MATGIYSRQLTPEDWERFRDTRLLALKNHQNLFGSTYEKESGYGPEQWQGTLGDTRHGVFGLFDGQDLIGLNAAFTYWNDESGKTAILAMWFLKEDCRGRGLFAPFVQNAVDWAKAQGRFERIIVSHRPGNEASRRTNQALGFVYTHTERETWPDGETTDHPFYEIRIER